LENLDENANVSRGLENIRVNIKISAMDSVVHCELKEQKPWYDEKRSTLLDQRKWAKLQWL
jgi:hypothetical protein